MRNEKQASDRSALLSLLRAVALAAISFVLFALLFSAVAFATKDPTGKIGLFAPAAFLLSGAVGAFLSAKKHGFFLALGAGLSFLLLLLLLGLILCGGELGFPAFLNGICYLAVAALFALVGARKKEKRRKRR